MTTRRDAIIALPLLYAAYHARAQTPKHGQPRRVGFIARMNPSETVEMERLFWSAMSGSVMKMWRLSAPMWMS